VVSCKDTMSNLVQCSIGIGGNSRHDRVATSVYADHALEGLVQSGIIDRHLSAACISNQSATEEQYHASSDSMVDAHTGLTARVAAFSP